MRTKTVEQIARKRMDVRHWTPGGRITGEILPALIESARAAAYAESGTWADNTYDVYVPAGTYDTEGPLAHFPGTGLSSRTPGLVGDGIGKTLFRHRGGMTGDQWYITTGDTGVDGSAYTFDQRLADFTVLGTVAPGSGYEAVGNGIKHRLTYNLDMENVQIVGFDSVNHTWQQGRGLEISRAEDETVANHQHVKLKNVRIHHCTLGFRLSIMGGLEVQHLHSMTNRWLAGTISGVSAAKWTVGNIQSKTQNSLDRWFGLLAEHAMVVTDGWDVATGQPSGTGASLSAPSGGTCTLTGLSGMDLTDVDAWIQLTDNSGGFAAAQTTGMYKILRVLSATSCVIAKNISGTGVRTVDYQVYKSYVNQLSVEGCYCEDTHRATFLFGAPDILANSIYEFGLNTTLGATNAYEIQAADAVSITSKPGGGTNSAFLKNTVRVCAPGVGRNRIRVDSFTRQGLVCARSGSGQTSLSGGVWDTAGPRARSVREAVRQLGAIEAWDARLPSTLTLDGTDVDAWAGYIGGTVLTPDTANIPQYAAADAGFAGPCVQTIGGGPGAAGGLTGQISGSLNTYNHPQGSSVFAVVRLPDTAVTTGSGANRRLRFVHATSAYASQLRLNDGVGSYAGSDFLVGATSRVVQAVDAIDTDPHALCFAGFARGLSGDVYLATDWHASRYVTGTNAVNELGKTMPVAGEAINVNFAGDSTVGGGTQGAAYIAFAAYFPFPLSEEETLALVDLARAEWPLRR